MRQNKTSPNFSAIWQAFLVCLILYLVFFILNKSYISAFEDLHIEYLLSGGYGHPPTLELHYLWGWHPFVFSPVYVLYGWAPEINWYGLFLVGLQFLAHFALVKALIVHLGFKRAFPLYLVFFLIFGFPLLQKLEISTTSSLLALSACTSLLMKLKGYAENRSFPFIRKNILLLALLLLAILIRLHTAFLSAALFSAAAIIILRCQQWKTFFLTILITFSTAFILFQFQKIIYQQNDQYEYLKNKSDLYFSLTNRPNLPIVVVDSIQKMESSFILNHFWIDSSMLTAQKIEPYVRPISFQSIGRITQNREFGYWAFQNNRIILLLMLLLIAASLLFGGYKMLTKSILLTILGIAAYFCLLMLFKMREHIILSISSFLFLSIVVLAGRETPKKDKLLAYVLFLSFFTIGLWRVVQQLKTKTQIDKNINATYNLVAEFALNPDILFIHPSNEGWFGLNAFDSPNRFPLKNVITRELITTGKSKPIFKSFGIDHLDDHLINNNKIVLLGVNQPDWQHYFEWKRQKQIKVVPGIKILNIPGFQIKTIQ